MRLQNICYHRTIQMHNHTNNMVIVGGEGLDGKCVAF